MKQRFIEEFSARHGIGADAVESLLSAVVAGRGTMAQFSHPDLGGMGQWSRGGMIMVGDMFNQDLKYRVDRLCTEISDALMQNPALAAESRPPTSGSSLSSLGAWWPEEFGNPSSSGAQNDLSYAFFPAARRLVVESAGAQTIYDTGEHMISGVSQQQGGDQSLSFSSQFGLVRLAELPRIDSAKQVAGGTGDEPGNHGQTTSAPPQGVATSLTPEKNAVPFSNSAPPASGNETRGVGDIFTMIERLADLHSKGILTEEEFTAKKAELLDRL
ncbi:SHOCT domain-containing protein [Ancylobacter sp.]|uniref:SHOCT domain-containing protein n=1 Tax=Ancylobacter sp. TaxID=1872567 RepID=UPI003D0EC282